MFGVLVLLKFAFETRFIHIKGIQTTLEPSPKFQDGVKARLCGAKFKI